MTDFNNYITDHLDESIFNQLEYTRNFIKEGRTKDLRDKFFKGASRLIVYHILFINFFIYFLLLFTQQEQFVKV